MSDNEFVQEWLRYSQNDLVSAYHLFEDLHPKQSEIACYLSQQCAEKALKGYLFFKDVEPPRIHNLVVLCQMCVQFDSTFLKILDACSDLTPYGVAVRYPNELSIDDTITKSAIDKAQTVYDFVVGKIQGLVVTS
jgi:HEPN domain-containing protein